MNLYNEGGEGSWEGAGWERVRKCGERVTRRMAVFDDKAASARCGNENVQRRWDASYETEMTCCKAKVRTYIVRLSFLSPSRGALNPQRAIDGKYLLEKMGLSGTQFIMAY